MKTGTTIIVVRNLWIGSLVAAAMATSAPSAFAIVAGGGAAAADCYAVFDGVDVGPKIECADGDPCDADGVPDGTCTFNVSVCAFQTLDGCTPQPVASYKGTWVGKGYPVPPTGVTESTCGDPQQFKLALRTKKGKLLKSKPTRLTLVAKATSGKPKVDKDRLQLVCTPAPPSCPANPAGGPSQLTLTVVSSTGSDLDTGESGKSHNFIVPSGSQLKYCLSGCDSSTNPVCQGSGLTDTDPSAPKPTLNGPTFGPPLPLFSANVAVCVVNRYQDPLLTATINIADGSFDASATPVRLLADTYQGTATQVCPRCVAGKCDSGRNLSQPCRVDGTVTVNNPPQIVNAKYPVSRDCLPAGQPLGTPNVSLGLVTATSTLEGNANGTFPCPGQVRHDECNILVNGGFVCNVPCAATPDFKGGLQQMCCSNPQSLPCFPTDPATGIGKIERTGTAVIAQPAWPEPTYPKTADGGVLASVFCIQSTTAPLVDLTAGLPGPGALLLPGRQVFTKPAATP